MSRFGKLFSIKARIRKDLSVKSSNEHSASFAKAAPSQVFMGTLRHHDPHLLVCHLCHRTDDEGGIYGNLSEEADATFSGLMESTQDIRQEINKQQQQIDTLWEKIEEIKNR